MTNVRFGALLIPNRGWDALVAQACEVEELGLDSVWIDDHLMNPGAPDTAWMEGWTTLAAIAARTSRIRLGTMMTNCALRPTVLLARMAATVDAISGGRLNLGLAPGYSPLDFELAGRAVPPAADRVAHFERVVRALDSLLRGEPTMLELADPVRGEPVVIAPKSQDPRMPFTIAAHGPKTLAIAARYGDTWNSFGGWELPANEHYRVTAERVQRLRELEAEAGREPGSVRCSLLAGSPLVTDGNIWASYDALRDFAGRYIEIGIREFVFYYPPESMYGRRAVPPGTFAAFMTKLQRELADHGVTGNASPAATPAAPRSRGMA